MPKIPMTKKASELEAHVLLSDSQDLQALFDYIGFPVGYREDITAALVIMGDCEYEEVWLSESTKYYLIDALYHNLQYYLEWR